MAKLQVRPKRIVIREGDEVAFLSRHFVALTCQYEATDAKGIKSHHSLVYSGFLLEVRGYTFWVTAGHCLKELDELLAAKGVRVHGGSFVDWFACGAVHKSPVPFQYETGRGFHLYQPENGFDFALIPLDLLQIGAFAANNLVPLSRANWVRQRNLSFDSYLMLGIPKDKIVTSLKDNGVMNVAVSQSLLRIERIGLEDLGETPWDSEAVPSDAWFIGRLAPGCTIRNLKGMSGGPIYGFRREGKGRFTYHVVALQSHWWNQQRTIFGCSVPLFADLVYQEMGKVMAKARRKRTRRTAVARSRSPKPGKGKVTSTARARSRDAKRRK